MFRCALMLGASVFVLVACSSPVTRPTTKRDVTVQDVLKQLKLDLAQMDRSPEVQAGEQYSCGDNQVEMKMVRKGIFAKASLNVSDIDDSGVQAGIDKFPIINIGVSGSAGYSDSTKQADSTSFEVKIPLSASPPTDLSALGQLVAAAENAFLTMPHDSPCLKPTSLTVTSVIQVTRTTNDQVGINYLIASAKHTWSRSHAYDGAIAVTIIYGDDTPQGLNQAGKAIASRRDASN